MTTLDVLMTARKILSNPKRWTKGSYRDTNDDGEACYCALGALRIAAGGDTRGYTVLTPNTVAASRVYFKAADLVAKASPPCHVDTESWVPSWNDNDATTHTEVMQVFADAIDAEIEASGQQRANVPAVTA